jgi:hypothetical protein
MIKNGDLSNLEYQNRLEESVLKYQLAVNQGNPLDIELCYKRVVGYYNPLDFYASWYDQYKYLFDSQEDFIADYKRVFVTVLLNWQPRNKRKKSRYEGSGEFKNYFIGSLYHNYINLVKSDQAAKRNITKMCPICGEWVNPISTHLISRHSELLWQQLEDLSINIDSLISCPFCTNFKISKNFTDPEKINDLVKSHMLSKHSSLLFTKFNELHPEVSTISPKIISTMIEEGEGELDIYEVTEDDNNLINKLFSSDLSDVQKNIIEQILNGDSKVTYKSDKYKCSPAEFDNALESLKELLTLYGVV